MSVPTPLLEYYRELETGSRDPWFVSICIIQNTEKKRVSAEVLCGECVASSPIDTGLLVAFVILVVAIAIFI